MLDGAAGVRASRLRPGTRLGRYTLLRRLGHGGMAEVYLARSHGPQGFRKLVALKLVLGQLGADASFIAMFLNEARIAGMLDHPNIAAVHELGRDGDDYFLAMEYVDGRDLRMLLARVAGERGLPLDCALSIVLHTAAALDYAHRARDAEGHELQIVHRDVSPSNILVRHDGCVKLVDFGIAKAMAQSGGTRSGVLKGKVGYMSPEQCRGEPLDRRADVFALGVVLYEVTTCRRLFFGDNDFATMNRIVKGDVPRPTQVCPGYPPALEAIVLRALQTDPDARHPTAAALRDELEAFATAARMQVSDRRLGEWMTSLGLGEPAVAVAAEEAAEVEPTDNTGTTRVRPTSPAPASRGPTTLGATLRTTVALAAGAAITAWIMRSEPDAAVVDGVEAVGDAVAEAKEEAAPPIPSIPPEPFPLTTPTPVSATPPVDVAPSVIAAPKATPAEPTVRDARRGAGRRNVRATKRKSTPAGDLDTMFPEGP